MLQHSSCSSQQGFLQHLPLLTQVLGPPDLGFRANGVWGGGQWCLWLFWNHYALVLGPERSLCSMPLTLEEIEDWYAVQLAAI